MTTTKRKVRLVLLVPLLAVLAYAKVTGPDAGYTDAPGDIGNCTACHDTFHQPNVGPGSVRIEDNPAVYEPGRQYTIAVTIQQGGRQRFGFQLTAIDSTGARAGTLTPLAGDTQLNVATGLGGRQYIQHSMSGTFPLGAGVRTWQFRWTAPATDVGTVRFHVAGNAADGNGTNQNDHIYTHASLSESPTTVVALTLLSDPAGLTLQAGSAYLIDWSATNPSNVDSFEARYSTDDGMTFPINNLIFSTTDSSVTSFEWTVPNKPTGDGEARIRLQAATKAGAAVEVRSGRFTIAGSGSGPAGPTIGSAKIKGRHLLVFGDEFQMGAVIEMDGANQKTKNKSDFSHQLKGKKVGDKIAPGQTVKLVVRNPDGGRSGPFDFTRPPL